MKNKSGQDQVTEMLTVPTADRQAACRCACGQLWSAVASDAAETPTQNPQGAASAAHPAGLTGLNLPSFLQLSLLARGQRILLALQGWLSRSPGC